MIATATLRALSAKFLRQRRDNHRVAQFESLESRQLLAADFTLPFSGPAEPLPEGESTLYSAETLPPSTFQQAGLMLDYGNAPNGLPLVSSNPSAAAKIYLDFDGHFEPQWGSYSNVTTPVWSLDSDTQNFNATEAARIRSIWRQVAEDFAPFNLDITTIEPDSFANREGLRVSIGGNGSWYGSNASGLAYRNTWTNSIVNTVYVFPERLYNNASYIAEVASHEVGHAFGLHHQSTYDSNGNLVREYSTGSGNWAPLMGNGMGKARTTWHNGTSTSSTTFQDDLAIITSSHNAFRYRQDDHGGLDNPTVLTLDVLGQARAVGVIERNDDLDAFTFEVKETSVGDFQVNVFHVAPNLRAKLELWSDDGVLIAAANPDSTFGASFTYQLDPGHYTLAVRNDGSYGSLGHYTVMVNIADSTPPPPYDPGEDEADFVMDSENGAGITLVGVWNSSSAVPGYHGQNYLHDLNASKGSKSVTFAPTLAVANEYEVYLIWAQDPNRASNVPVDIIHAGGTTTVTVDQRTNGGKWNLLGTFSFDVGMDSQVRIRTTGTDGVVIADAVRFVSIRETTPPTAELADPAHDSSIDLDSLNARGYLDVTFADVGSGLDTASILDSGAEFTLVGSAATGVVVNGAPTLVSDTTYRYHFTGEFSPGLVEVHFLHDSFQDQHGNGNLSSQQSFTVVGVATEIDDREEIVLDSENGQGVAIVGSWSPSTGVPGYEGENYFHDLNDAKGSKSVTFTPNFVASGEYEVHAIWTSHSNRASNVPVDIIHASGTSTVSVNQRVNGGNWNFLGTYTFEAGTDGQVRIRTSGTNGYVIVDAVKFVPIPDTTPPTADLADPAHETSIELETLNARGYLDVTFTDLGSGLNTSTITDSEAEFTLVGEAVSGVTVSGAAIWISDTTFRYPFSGSFTKGLVEVHFLAGTFRDQAGNDNLASVQSFTVSDESRQIADVQEIVLDSEHGLGITVVGTWSASTGITGYEGEAYFHDMNSSKGTKSITFSPNVVAAGQYEVYLNWTEHENRASNVPVDVIHAHGTSTLSMNQRVNGGQWNLLGTFTFDTGTNGQVRIRTNGTNGVVIADAVRFAPANGPSSGPSANQVFTNNVNDGNLQQAWQSLVGAAVTSPRFATLSPTNGSDAGLSQFSEAKTSPATVPNVIRWTGIPVSRQATELYFADQAIRAGEANKVEWLGDDLLDLLASQS